MGPGLCPGVGRGSPAGWCRGFTLLAGATVSLKQRFPSCPQIDVWVEARLQKIIYAGAAPQSSCGFRYGVAYGLGLGLGLLLGLGLGLGYG